MFSLDSFPITFQTYDSSKHIGKFFCLKRHCSLEGDFLEVFKESYLTKLVPEFKLKQVNISICTSNRINAFHCHPKSSQSELWFCLKGKMKVVLVGENNLEEYNLSEHNPGLLYIPPNVLHGFQTGNEGAILIYLTDREFNPKNPDEGRVPYDYFESKYPNLWKMDTG